jgi:hypothetical protein
LLDAGKNKRSLLFSQRCEAIADFGENRQAPHRYSGHPAADCHEEGRDPNPVIHAEELAVP